MQYNLTISEHNLPAHLDIESDIQKQKNGIFTFILRIDNSNICDYNVLEYTDARDYLVIKQVTVEEQTISHHHYPGDRTTPLRPDDSRRSTS